MPCTVTLLIGAAIAYAITVLHLLALLVLLFRRPHTFARMILADLCLSILRLMVMPVLRPLVFFHLAPRILTMLILFHHAYARQRAHELGFSRAGCPGHHNTTNLIHT